MLGKIIDGSLTYPPHRIVLDGMQIFNPAEEQLLSAGYKAIQETPMPDDAPEGQHYEARYEDAGEYITQIWELVEDEVIPVKPSIADYIDTRIAEISRQITPIQEEIVNLSE